MRERLDSFVPVADEVARLQRVESPEGELFRELAEQGHYAGRTEPTNTRQGIYAAAPSGRLLASVNTRSAERVASMLDEALARWAALPEEERYLPPARVDDDGGWRWEQLYPSDGLVLRVHVRDLPRGSAPPDDWRGSAANRDYAWFRRAELAGWVPEPAEIGATADVPSELVGRLARVHLVDTVRGQTPAFRSGDVESAALAVKIVGVDGARVALTLEGGTRTVAKGAWPIAGYRDMQAPTEQERGVETALRGRAVWDTSAERFVAFELVGLGTRWGGTQYNARADDLAPAGIGFALVLADENERVAPAAMWEYGWR